MLHTKNPRSILVWFFEKVFKWILYKCNEFRGGWINGELWGGKLWESYSKTKVASYSKTKVASYGKTKVAS